MKNYLIIIFSLYSFLIFSQDFESDCVTKDHRYTDVIQNDKNAVDIALIFNKTSFCLIKS